MDVSVILICQGNEPYLFDTINSILSQDYTNFEVLIYHEYELQIAIEKNADVHTFNTYDMENLGEIRKRAISSSKGHYLYFIRPNDLLSDKHAISEMYGRCKNCEMDVLAEAIVPLENGIYYFYYQLDDSINRLTLYNAALNFREYNFLRTLEGKYFKREILERLTENELMDSLQSTLMHIYQDGYQVYFILKSYYIWRVWENVGLPEIDWTKRFIFSNIDEIGKNMGYSVPNYLQEQRIEVAICVDEKQSDYVQTLIYSLDKNATRPVDLYIVYRQVKSHFIENILKLSEKLRHVQIIFKQLPVAMFDILKNIPAKKGSLPVTACFRLLLAEILNDIDRVIYLDTDMLVLQDLGRLWETDLGMNLIAACRDHTVNPNKLNEKDWAISLLGMTYYKDYINSGMLLMNLKMMRKYNVSIYLLNFAMENGNFLHLLDQDIINLFFHNHISILDEKYNYAIPMFDKDFLELEDITVLHFLGSRKPWLQNLNYSENERAAFELYKEYQEKLEKLID